MSTLLEASKRSTVLSPNISKLEELKATAAKLQQQIEALEKPNQWEPRGGEWTIFLECAHIRVAKKTPSKAFATAGLERQTKEAANKAQDDMRTHNRLLAYVDEFGGDWEADWSDMWQAKYYVNKNNQLGSKWSIKYTMHNDIIGAVHMSQDCADGLIAKLKSGEVIL